MLKTGMIIAERYEILGKIGTGGMADVYKAKDHKLNRFVAVKVLKPEFREDTTFIRKFRSEAQAAAGLTHPNIVRIFDSGEVRESANETAYIVMEFLRGQDLVSFTKPDSLLPLPQVLDRTLDILTGMALPLALLAIGASFSLTRLCGAPHLGGTSPHKRGPIR